MSCNLAPDLALFGGAVLLVAMLGISGFLFACAVIVGSREDAREQRLQDERDRVAVTSHNGAE